MPTRNTARKVQKSDLSTISTKKIIDGHAREESSQPLDRKNHSMPASLQLPFCQYSQLEHLQTSHTDQ